MAFQLDTSGLVDADDGGHIAVGGQLYLGVGRGILSPFTQGYIEALFADLPVRSCGWCKTPADEAAAKTRCRRHPQCTKSVRQERARLYAKRFSDLAPEALARIIADCEAYLSTARRAVSDDAKWGRNFWRLRQAGGYGAERAGGFRKGRFPPLTVQLGDDGKVRFAEDQKEA